MSSGARHGRQSARAILLDGRERQIVMSSAGRDLRTFLRARAAQARRSGPALGAASIALLAVAACAPSTGAVAAPPSAVTASHGVKAAGSAARRSTGSAAGDTDPNCTRATKVKIVERSSPAGGHTYSFSPRRLTIPRGGFLAVTNTSDEVHALVSTPDAGIVTSVIDRDERQVIQFPKAGTFTVESAASAHRAALRVTVSGESGCGATGPTLKIVDGYSFRPAKLSVEATENFAVVNDSSGAQTVNCTPDPGGNRDHSRLDQGETQLLAIDEPGRYVCASVQHPDAKVVIQVR
jgi:plastocyanin